MRDHESMVVAKAQVTEAPTREESRRLFEEEALFLSALDVWHLEPIGRAW